MKQILKLAELNWIATLARREEIAAKESGNEDRIMSAEHNVEITAEAEDKQLNSKYLQNEFNKYQERKDEVRTALVAAGYDTAIMDYWC